MDLAQILIKNGHTPDAVDGYPLCRIEAFVESALRLEHSDMKSHLMTTFIGSQGDNKAVKKYMETLDSYAKHKEYNADDLLSDFKRGFKGMD